MENTGVAILIIGLLLFTTSIIAGAIIGKYFLPEKDTTELNQKVDSQTKNIESLRTTLDDINKQLIEMEKLSETDNIDSKDLIELLNKIESLKNDIKTLNIEINKLEDNNDDLKEDLEDLDDDYRNLYTLVYSSTIS